MTPGSPSRERKGWLANRLAFALKAFAEVRPGEGVTALLLAANIFLVLSAYYLVKVAREPLILLGGGAEVKSYAGVGQSILLVFVANAYSWLAAKAGRLLLISSVSLFFVANLFFFAVLGARGVAVGVPFFLWVGIFNVVTVAQFWSFAADIYTEEQGKRLFPLVGVGSSVGAVAGSTVAGPMIARSSPYVLMTTAAFVLVSALVLTWIVSAREARRGEREERAAEAPMSASNGFSLVLRDKYLLTFALLVLLLNVVTKSGDYVLDKMLLAEAQRKAGELGVTAGSYIGEFKARYFEWINTLGVVLQMFVVSRVVKYAGIRAALVVIPLVSVAGYSAALIAPLAAVLFVGRVAESSLDYSLSNTTQQTLWLVTSRDAKYKAKQVIDTFVKRAGDTTSALVVWIGSHLAFGARTFLAVNVGFSLAWCAVAWTVGRRYAKKSRAQGAERPQRQALAVEARA